MSVLLDTHTLLRTSLDGPQAHHLQLATTLIAYCDARKCEAWDAEGLNLLLAGLDQLLPSRAEADG